MQVVACRMRPFLALLLALALSPAASAFAAPLVVGTYAYPDRDRVAAVQPLADLVGARSGRPVQVVLWPSPSALVDAFRGGAADVIVPNLHAYLEARAGAVTLPVPDVSPAHAARYRSVIVARGIERIGQLTPARVARLRLALVAPDSASGGFVPLARLRGEGVRPEAFASVEYAGSHAAVGHMLADGRADIGALAAEVHDAAPPAGLAVLWRSAPIPPGPLLCRRAAHVPCHDIARWLLESNTDVEGVLAGLRAGWPEFGDAVRFREATGIADAPDAAVAP